MEVARERIALVNSYQTSSGSLNYWLIIDTVRVPDALEVLSQFAPFQNVFRLFATANLQHLIEHSPLVLNLGTDKAVLECLSFEDFDTSSVVFALDEQCDEEGFLVHLQQLFLAHIDSKPSVLRFYSGSFWQPIYQDLDDDDISTLLGPARAVIWFANSERHQLDFLGAITALPQQPYVLMSDIFNTWV
ncbi:DUF4123 domain-containing protein [Vibrio panuliri]|nr:DUF4123 domain-containing protein [Vibrio panuliri]